MLDTQPTICFLRTTCVVSTLLEFTLFFMMQWKQADPLDLMYSGTTDMQNRREAARVVAMQPRPGAPLRLRLGRAMVLSTAPERVFVLVNDRITVLVDVTAAFRALALSVRFEPASRGLDAPYTVAQHVQAVDDARRRLGFTVLKNRAQ